MGTRLELQAALEDIFAEFLAGDNDVTDAIQTEAHGHVYFQPPETFKMSYPCIVYTLGDIDIRHADNYPYKHKKRYTVTVIDRNPDSTIPGKIGKMQSVSFDRHFTNENLHHFVYQLYY